jgi:hypothetical protein
LLSCLGSFFSKISCKSVKRDLQDHKNFHGPTIGLSAFAMSKPLQEGEKIVLEASR